MAINKDKSAVIHIRVDQKQRMPPEDSINGIKIVQEYKYLGVTLNDTLSFKSLLS